MPAGYGHRGQEVARAHAPATAGQQKARIAAGSCFEQMAEWTGLEPATSGVTGQHSNRLNYHSAEPGDDTEALPSAQQTAQVGASTGALPATRRHGRQDTLPAPPGLS